ncbi:unnamed protein product [Staurois parvus]|uniref:Uncharacterized protein n=1 Tax=Staurois parvus TaxID=386267 RepID=A0ABN9H2Q3_9NEOB|nr:unnamed protein product [Staurois parvus]
MISALMIGAQQCHPPVPPTCAQQCTHLCPAVPPNCAHPPVPTSATHLCPSMQCCQSVPGGCASQCPAVAPVSAQQ